MHLTFEFSTPNQATGSPDPLRYRCDTDQVEEFISRQLLSLVKDSGLWDEEPPADTALDAGLRLDLVRDAAEYDLLLQKGEARRSFSWNDGTVPKSAWPLVRFLKQQAIERRLQDA